MKVPQNNNTTLQACKDIHFSFRAPAMLLFCGTHHVRQHIGKATDQTPLRPVGKRARVESALVINPERVLQHTHHVSQHIGKATDRTPPRPVGKRARVESALVINLGRVLQHTHCVSQHIGKATDWTALRPVFQERLWFPAAGVLMGRNCCLRGLHARGTWTGDDRRREGRLVRFFS